MITRSGFQMIPTIGYGRSTKMSLPGQMCCQWASPELSQRHLQRTICSDVPLNDSRMDLWWSSDSSMNIDNATKFFVVLYFAEVEAIRENALRQFDILLDNNTLVSAFSPISMMNTFFSGIVQGSGSHGISLVATSISDLQHLISTMEIFLVHPLNESATYSEDASSMMIIQTKFSVKRNWQVIHAPR